MAGFNKGTHISYSPLSRDDMPDSSIVSSGGNNLSSSSDSIENMTDSGGKIHCRLPGNKNNPVCNIADAIFDYLPLFVIIGIMLYALIVFAAMKTKNQNLKIFLIVSIFLPFLTPIGLIIALLVITNVI